MKLLALTINNTKIEGPGGIPDPSNVSIQSLLGGILSLMVVGGVILALFYIAYGGWLWINSAGDKEKIRKARMTIIYTFVGLVIITASILIVNIITNLVGLTK